MKGLPGRAANIFRHNRVASNFLFLASAQFVSLLVPLFVTPFLVAKLGVLHFGLITFGQSIMLLLLSVVDFGFNVSATRKISIGRTSASTINRVFSNVIAAKVLLLLAAFILLLFLLIIPRFQTHSWFYFSSFLIVVGQAIFPVWVYQGIEKMQGYAIISIIGKLLYVVLLVLLVKQPSDFIWVNILFGASLVVSSILSLLHLHFRYDISFKKPSIKGVTTELKDSSIIFLSTVSINVYTNINATILGLFAGYEAVGLYGIAEKIMMVLKQAPIVFSQVFYPAACKAASESFAKLVQLLQRGFIPFLIFFSLFCLVAFFNTHYIVYYFIKGENPQLQTIIRIIIIAVFITSLNIPAYQTLLSFNFQKSYSFTLSLCCITSVMSCLFLTYNWGIWGTTINALITEIFVTGALYFILHMRHRNYSLLNRSIYV